MFKIFQELCDNLHKFDVKCLGPFIFCGLSQNLDFGLILNEINKKVYFLPLEEFLIAHLYQRLFGQLSLGALL